MDKEPGAAEISYWLNQKVYIILTSTPSASTSCSAPSPRLLNVALELQHTDKGREGGTDRSEVKIYIKGKEYRKKTKLSLSIILVSDELLLIVIRVETMTRRAEGQGTTGHEETTGTEIGNQIVERDENDAKERPRRVHSIVILVTYRFTLLIGSSS